jgi:hypothetical protein
MEMLTLVETGNQGAIFRTRLPDQADWFGVLAKVCDLNLTLIEVQRAG